MRKFSLLLALLCASVMGFAIDWDGIGWLANSGDKYKLSITPNFSDDFGGKRVEGTNLWIGFPSAAFGEMSIPQSGGAGAWKTFALSNFPNLENQFTVVCDGTTYTFDVYYADGSTKSNPALSLNSAAETLDAAVPETFQIVPSQSGDGAISYESSNAGIASVDNTGLVTAVGRGTATITVSTAETASYAAASKTLTVTVTGPINWSAISWLGGSNDKYKLAVSPEISDTYGGKHVESTNLWIGFPSAAFGAMSIEPSDGAGAWKTFALSNFPAQENQFTVECGGTTYTFDVFYADGTTGGGGDPEPTEIYDTNFALASLGASATSDNGGTANNAIDNNDGSSWESTHGIDAVKLTIDLGQKRIFNTVQIRWEGAYGKAFTIDVSNDGTDWTTVKSVDETLPGPFPYEQTLEFSKTTAQYIRFNGIERGLPYGYNMFSFRVLLPGVSTLTSITLNAAAAIAEAGGAGVALTAQPKDQNGQNMEAEVSWEITPAAAGHMSGSTFIPDQAGSATIRAYNGEIFSPAVTIAAYSGSNVALEKEVEASGYDDVNNLLPSFAVDNNEGSLWSARVGETGAERVYDAWIIVDLGAFYDINLIALRWEGACSRHYHVDFSEDKSAWRTAYNAGWDAIATHWEYLSGTAESATKVRYVRVWSTEAVSQYGVKIMDLKVFGVAWVPSGDTEAPVMTSASLVSNTYDQAIIAVSATDADGEVARYHVVDATNGIDANYVPEAGNITITGLTHATSYNFTITAVDLANHESANSIIVPVTTPFDVTVNLALNQPCEAGFEDGNPAETAAKANDGDENSSWVTYADRPASEEWWYVDLGDVYTLSNITVVWGEPCATNYILQARVEAPATADKADDAAWVTLATVMDGAINSTKSSDVSGIGRYVRIRSLARSANFFRLKEFRVFGSGVTAADTEKPTMGAASLVSNTDSHAIISVSASDGEGSGIASYRVVDAGNSFDATFAPVAGQITVTGLTGGTNYTLFITAVDFFGNESENSQSVAVTTVAHYTEPQTAAPVPAWPAEQVKSLYSNTYALAPASINSYNETWWSWPAMTEGNIDGNTYLHYNLAADGMIGWQFAEISVASMEKLHIDIFSSGSGTLTIRPITTGGPEVRKTLTLVGQQWNSFDVALTEFPGHDWSKLFQFAIEYWNAGGLTGEHISVDNVYLYRESALVDGDAPTNVTATAANSFYSVKITAQAEDNSGAVNFSVKNGDTEVATGAAASGAATTITVNNLTPGTAYNFNVIASDDAGNEAAPVAVAANTLAAPAAAPVPTEDAANVMAVFSDAYTPVVTVGNYCEWWWESPTVHNVTLGAGDNARFYDNNHSNVGSFGWSWSADNKIDFSGFQKFHLHIYPAQSGTIEIYPVIAPEGEFHKVSQTLTAGQWNEIVLDYTDKTFAPLNQIGFVNFFGLGDFFIDNVYFFAEAPEPEWETVRTGLEVNRHYTVCLEKNIIDIDGATFWSLDKRNQAGTMAYLEEELAPEAGKPYIIQATKATLKVVYGDETAAAPVANGALRGTFVYMDKDALAAAGTNIYMLFNNELRPIGSNNHLDAHRAYVLYNELQAVSADPVPAPGRRVKGMPLQRDAATGIDELNASEAPVKMVIDGQFFILRGENTYDATGRLVK